MPTISWVAMVCASFLSCIASCWVEWWLEYRGGGYASSPTSKNPRSFIRDLAQKPGYHLQQDTGRFVKEKVTRRETVLGCLGANAIR